jgi:hypothetical protein
MSNFLISCQGRGASYGFMLSCDDDEVTARCQNCLKSGFEVFIYKIEQSPLGNPGFRPEGAITLRRVWHLYNAHEEFKEEARSIINRLDAHSVESSREYLDIMINELTRERTSLNGQVENQQVQTSGGQVSGTTLVPQTSTPESGSGQNSQAVKED